MTTNLTLMTGAAGVSSIPPPPVVGSGVIGVPSASFLFIASGTYTPTAGISSAIVECRGGGGMGGAAFNGGYFVIGGGGGGSGAYSKAVFRPVTIGASQVVTVGIGDTAGTGGGASSFGTLLTAPGGSPGAGNDATSAFGGGGAGGIPGSGPAGALLLSGVAGLPGSNNPVMTWISGTPATVRPIAVGGQGGLNASAPLATSPIATAAGTAGTMGAGGNGAVSAGENNPASTAPGGAGGSGWVLVTEYSPT